MFPGVRPNMSLASFPTASTRPFTLLMATIDGSLTTMPLPRAYTQVLAVPRSMARSLENNDNIDRRLTDGSSSVASASRPNHGLATCRPAAVRDRDGVLSRPERNIARPTPLQANAIDGRGAATSLTRTWDW